MTDKEIQEAANKWAKRYGGSGKHDFIAGAKWAIEKSDAIEFGDWLLRSAPTLYTTQELYELFKESKK